MFVQFCLVSIKYEEQNSMETILYHYDIIEYQLLPSLKDSSGIESYIFDKTRPIHSYKVSMILGYSGCVRHKGYHRERAQVCNFQIYAHS